MACCGFVFDFIIVRVAVPSLRIEDNNRLSVIANFIEHNLEITPSRINVVEFKPDRSFEFDMLPWQLRQELADNPLKITLVYDSQVIGTATVPWKKNFLQKINKNMGEVTHIDSCELFCSEDCTESVGVLEYVCRLQCKCEESDNECEQFPKCDTKKCINRNINPEDVIFVIAEPEQQDDCDVCSVMDFKPACDRSSEGFDLSPYRAYNGKTINDSEIVNTCYNPNCCEIMRTADPCKCLFDLMDACCKCKCEMPASCRTCPQSRPTYSYCTPPCTNRCQCSKKPSKCQCPCRKIKSSTANCCNACNIKNFLKPTPYTICNRQASSRSKKCGGSACALSTQCMSSNCQTRNCCGVCQCLSRNRKCKDCSGCDNKAQFGCNKCPRVEDIKFMRCKPCTADPCAGRDDANKIKSCSSTKSVKNETIYLLCGSPTVDPCECLDDTKTTTPKSKGCTTREGCKKCPKNDKLYLMPCMKLDNKINTSESSLDDNSQMCVRKSSAKKDKSKLRCNHNLILDYRRSIRKETQNILTSCRDLKSKTALSLPNTTAKGSANRISSSVANMSVDDIMKEFLKD